MEQQRTFLILLLAAVSVMIYFKWQEEYGPKTPSTVVSQDRTTPSSELPAGAEQSTPQETTGDDVAMPVPESQPGSGTQTQSAHETVAKSESKLIHIETDVFKLAIDTRGGTIREADLLKYPVSEDEPDNPFRLMDVSKDRIFDAQQGFHVADKKLKALTPNSSTIFSSAKDSYKMEGDTLTVDLSWTNSVGMTFTERFEFTRGSYSIKITHEIKNPSELTWKGYSFARLERTPKHKKRGLGMLPTYTGPVYYSPENKYNKIKFSKIDDIADIKKTGPLDWFGVEGRSNEFAGGWIGMIEHYFVGAYIPKSDEVYRYFTQKPKRDGDLYWIGLMSTQKTVKPKQTLASSIELYVGPKIQKRLEALAPGLELSVDYGWLTFISKPLFWLLNHIHSLLGNWGWAIIVLTLMIKLVFYKLSETSYKSMARMKKLAPRMKQISDRYADDRQRKGQAIMELYKKEKVNPMSGCLPILVQIPVFIALYYMILESVELRQAPWIFWITDLSLKDPYYVLPVLMGISMLATQKLNPAPPDPMQAKMMMALPFVFTVLFLFFPSGLVLYWVVNNVLSMAQQWYITRVVMAEKKPT